MAAKTGAGSTGQWWSLLTWVEKTQRSAPVIEPRCAATTRVNDKRIDPATGERQRLSSAILPARARKSPWVAEVVPLLYLHGLSGERWIHLRTTNPIESTCATGRLL
jgi:hypothetical protein